MWQRAAAATIKPSQFANDARSHPLTHIKNDARQFAGAAAAVYGALPAAPHAGVIGAQQGLCLVLGLGTTQR